MPPHSSLAGLPRDRSALFAYGVLCLIVLGLVGLLVWTGDPAFGRFLGPMPPLGVFAGVAVLGAVLFATVMARAGFAVVRTGAAGGWVRAAVAAAAFGAVVVTADFFIVFPRDMNVPYPRSLAFYPAIGFLVEVLFHVVPLSVLLFPLAFIKDLKGRDRLVYGALAATALLEPAYQTLPSASSWSRPAAAFILVHVLAFNAVELWLFRRFDFITMFGFRLMYYLVWHVTWGAWRLEILF